MPEDNEQKHHTKSDIYKFLKRSFFSVLSFKDSDKEETPPIKNELMIFNTDDAGDFYLTLKKDKSHFSGIDKNKNVSLLIYKEEETLENISRVVIKGEAKIIEDLNSDEAMKGFTIIGEKSPLIKHLMYEDDEDKQKYTLIFVKSNLINYVSMKETIEGIDPTILARK
jgi:nitroimidazol reductase NimA-like FMN-containing flavoprotein (pyridoxamine 5'-phosphate oxidase superfamily)